MGGASESKPVTKAAERSRRYRERMRARGLRRVELWLPDTRAPGFAEEIRRQCLAISQSEGEAEALEFIEQTAAWPED